MAPTKLADVLVPDVWAQYVIERTAEKSELFQSGILTDLTNDMRVSSALAGGTIVNLPFYQDLSGDDEVIDDTTDLTINKIDTDKDVAAVLIRAKVFGATDLSGELSGDDPMGAIADRFADYWTRRMQAVLISTLNGAMAGVTDNVLDISSLSGAAANFDGEAFIDATGKLGDHQDILAAMAVHSATYSVMKKQGLIDFIPDQNGAETIPTYQGKRLIVDDGMPVSSGTYTSYLFAAGSIAYAEGSPKVPAEADREALKNGGQEFIVNRKKFVMHPRGIAWTPGSGVPAKPTPSNAELAASGNWNQVYESKNIRIVQFKHKLGG